MDDQNFISASEDGDLQSVKSFLSDKEVDINYQDI